MLILLVYLIANFFLSAYAERNRRKTTVIAHAILFFFTLGVLIVCTNKRSVDAIVGAEWYDTLMAAMQFGTVSPLLPFAALEIFVVAQLLISLLLVAVDVVFAICTKKKQFTTVPDDNCTDACSALPYVDRHKYYTYSVLRC